MKNPGLADSVTVLRTHISMFGVVHCARALLSYAFAPKYNTDSFDATYGTDTTEWVPNHDAKIPKEYSADAIQYEPTNIRTFRHVMRRLPVKVNDYTFIDIGCGKGRNLLLASGYPFREIVGVELSPITAAVAEKNVRKYLAENFAMTKNVWVKQDNALTYPIPDGNLLFFMYNPFVGEVFRKMIDRLHQAFMDNPGRDMLIVYVNPWRGQNAMADRFECVSEHQVIPRNWSWSLWRPTSTLRPSPSR